MKMVSACLLGIRCTLNGDNRYRNERILDLFKGETLIPVCPEQLGGMATPRAPQEIQSGTGEDVLDGRCKVLDKDGLDVTKQLVKGAEEALKIARQLNAKEFIA